MVILRLRQLRMTAAEIAETLAMPLSTVSVVLRRNGVGKLGRIGLEQPVRYERSRPGELVHIDIKKLGRIKGGAGWRVTGPKHHYNTTLTDPAGKRRNTVGWEYVHVAVDDYSRLAYAEVLLDEKTSTAAGFLHRATAHYRHHGITIERVLTDNGSCYRGVVHAVACRFNGWAYGAVYRTSQERTHALDGWLWHYNHQRRHSALDHQPPASRTNLLGSYT